MSEDKIGQFTIARISDLGYGYQHGPGMAPDGPAPKRTNYNEVDLKGRLLTAQPQHQQACRIVDRTKRTINPCTVGLRRREPYTSILNMTVP